ncbi:MAG: hypothetical protein ACREAA_06525 [Candidatus Polarisedimenticolia bacterium]
MANTPTSPQPFELRVPGTGIGGLGSRATLFIVAAGMLGLGLAISVLLAQGQVRAVTLILMAVLGLFCLTPRRGVFLLLIFLPFMYFIRRLVLNFQAFEARDPILTFPAVVTLAMFMGVVIFHRQRLLHYFTWSPTLKTCVFLMGVFLLQIVNPVQGSILVGIAGAMFFMVPMAWCFFGLLMTRKDMRRLMTIVLVIGGITALYGLYQHFFGLNSVEVYEAKSKNFYKTFGRDNVRVMSTFASPGDYSQYLMVAGVLAFTSFWRSKKNLVSIAVFLLILFAMVWISVRAAILLLLFALLMSQILNTTTATRVFARGAAALVVVMGIYITLYSYNPEQMYDSQFSRNPYVVHTLSGITHPTQERSFQGRIESWTSVVLDAFTRLPVGPVGHGIGSTTTAAAKFEGGRVFAADSYYFELFYGSGLAAGLLFSVLIVQISLMVVRLCLARPDIYEYRILGGLIFGLLLGAVFGQAPRDTISGPFMWLVIGFMLRESIDLAGKGFVEPRAG